jgi:hypothetical protein
MQQNQTQIIQATKSNSNYTKDKIKQIKCNYRHASPISQYSSKSITE